MTTARPLALVTGGLQRIGAVIAGRLAEAGYDLALHRRSHGEPDEALAAAIERNNAQWHSFSADLTEPQAAQSLFDAVTSHFGRPPDVLINNASLFGDGDWTMMDEKSQSRHLAANTIAPVQLARHVAAAARARGRTAVVINLIDQRVRNPVPDQFAYTLSKQALWQATRTMALAMAPHVRVNAVAPGLTLPTDAYPPGQMDRVAAMMPLGRLPTPTDIADAVLYLVTAQSVTGQTIFVDGGASLKSYERDFIAL